MNNTIRIRTTPGEGNKYLQFQLNHNYDFIEILSLKLRQEDLYRLFCSEYGVVVGRVIANSGFGVPNARVSIFVPIKEDDKENDLILGLYPYEYISDKDSKGTRYNLLPKRSRFDCHTPVGNLPTKREILDNDIVLEIYEKYYKFTTRTNEAGDFMIFGVPTGNWKMNVDVDLSDIGIVSQKPFDFIRQGEDKKRFEHVNKFKKSNNLNDLPQIFHTETSVNVLPFWGDRDNCQVGLNRIDVELTHRIEPQAFFIGSIFGDNEKNSVSKRCDVRRNLGNLCETVAAEGTIEMIRKTLNGQSELFLVEGGRVIDENGVWAYQVPMNLDYYVTDEFGNLVPTEDPTKGIPTRARVRFKIGMDVNGEEGRLRRRAKFLVPNNNGLGNYDFDETTPDEHFRDLYWNKVYTIKQFIPRFQPTCITNKCATIRKFLGIKNVDDCGDHTPFPFNRMDTNINPLYSIICVLLSTIVFIVAILNRYIIWMINWVMQLIFDIMFLIVKGFCFFKHLSSGNRKGGCRCFYCKQMTNNGANVDCVAANTPCDATCQSCANQYDPITNASNACSCGGCSGKCDSCKIKAPIGYITLECDDKVFMPWFITNDHKTCDQLSNDAGQYYYCVCKGSVSTSTGEYIECQQIVLAEALNIFKFDFYNDWINGTLFAFLFKQKIKKRGEGKNKFCDYDCDDFPNPTNNDPNDGDPSDNNCKINWIVDTCQEYGDAYYLNVDKLADSASKKQIKDGVIKLYKDEYYYAASTHYGYPLFRTDLVLLGSINSCDIHGIPLIYNKLINTTYNRPPITDEFVDPSSSNSPVAVSNIADLLFDINCQGVFTDLRHCYNIRKICELGVGLDEYREDDNTYCNDIIGNEDIEDKIIRNTFTILNENGIDDISAIATNYHNNVLTYDTDFGPYYLPPGALPNNPQYPTYSLGMGVNYFSFRGFDDGGSGSPRLPKKNSYYFYFGIHPGKTGLDKFYQEFVQPCVVEIDDDLILSATTTPVTIYGGNNGTISLAVLNGTSPYDFVIKYPDGTIQQFNNQTSPYQFTNLETGTYQITVEDEDGTEAYISVYVSGPTPVTMFADPIPVTTYGGNDGKIVISNCGGGTPLYNVCIIAPTAYAACHNNLDSTDTVEFTNLPAGTYTVRITDSGGQASEQDVIIDEPTQLIVTVTQTQEILCFGGTDAVLSINISGGQPPYDYQTVLLGTSNVYNGLNITGPAGTYQTTVTDVTGQQVVVLTNVTQPSQLVVSLSTWQNPSCYSNTDGFINVSVAGGIPPYSYSWSKDGSAYSTSQNISSLAADVTGNTYSLIVTDANGCSSGLDKTLNAPPELTLSRSVAGTNVTLTATGGNTGSRTFMLVSATNTYTYTTTYMSHTFYGVATGHYYIVRVIDNKGCVANAADVTIV